MKQCASFAGRWPGRPLGVVLAVMLGAACEYYDKPNQPLPASFEAQTLTGEVLNVASLRGRPWVINIWVPG